MIRAYRIALFVVGVPLLVVAFYLMVLGGIRTFGLLALPYQAEYGEGPVLDWARQIANGTLPYKPINTLPYNFSVYTPLYLAFSGILIPLFPDNPYVGGRLISLLSALGLALLIGFASGWGNPSRSADAPHVEERLNRTSPLGVLLLTILLWLLSPYVFRWATFFRPDMLALFWSGLGMVLVSRFPFPVSRLSRGETGLVAVAALCFVLAFFTKQSFFAAPLAALMYLVATKQYHYAIRLGVAGAVLGGGVALGLYAVSGWALVENWIAANANPFSWEAVWFFWSSFLATVPILILIGVWGLRRRENWLWGMYLGIAVAVSLSIGKAGAWENYFLEPLWILCLLASRAAPRAVIERRGVVVSLLLILLQLFCYLPGYERLSISDEQAWIAGVRAEGAALQAAVANIPPETPIYSEQMGVLAEPGRSIPLHSFVYTQLARQGIWDETPLTTRLAAGEGVVIQRFDAVNDPLERGRWTTGMLDAIERGYGFGASIGEWVMRPATETNRFYFPYEPTPLENGLALLNWEAESCTATGTCAIGKRGVELFANGTLTVHTLWQSGSEINTPLSISIKLFDPAGNFITQQDGAFRNGWMGDGWRAGAVLRDMPRTLTLPAPLPDGAYDVEATLYERESGTVIAITRIPYFKVSPPPVPRPSVSDMDIRFGSRFFLVGATPLPDTLRAGETLTLELTYQSWEWDASRYTTFLHVLAEDGTLVAQNDGEPSYPPYVWSDGERVTLPYTLIVPADLAAGRYQILVGWYNSDSLLRLSTNRGSDFVELGDVMVVE